MTIKNATMTDFDKQLIEKAEKISRWHYRDIDVLISIADTREARDILSNIRECRRDSVQETL